MTFPRRGERSGELNPLTLGDRAGADPAGHWLCSDGMLVSGGKLYRCSRPWWREELPPGGDLSEQSWRP
jgi:hypothetical protein